MEINRWPLTVGVGRIARTAESRIRRGEREIVWSPQAGLGFGNMLYAYLYAAGEAARGRDCRVLNTPVMTAWFEPYPRLWTELTVERHYTSRRDRRRWVWHSRFGEDFSRTELQQFISDFLIDDREAGDPREVVVNVRRGDYYDTPHFRGTYSFDIAGYLELALGRCAQRSAIHKIVFVSDGLEWCRIKLDGVARRFSGDVVYFQGSPLASFERVATAPRLVGTNSSFSYWAGYVSGVINSGREHVVMPRFHARLGEDWSAYQLDPSWDVVENIPGGWNA